MAIKLGYNRRSSGDVSYGRKVVYSIATLAAVEINGVASLAGKKIRLSFAGNSVNVDIYVNIVVGHSVADTACKMQENIKDRIETMSTYKVGIINVNVLGVAVASEDAAIV